MINTENLLWISPKSMPENPSKLIWRWKDCGDPDPYLNDRSEFDKDGIWVEEWDEWYDRYSHVRYKYENFEFFNENYAKELDSMRHKIASLTSEQNLPTNLKNALIELINEGFKALDKIEPQCDICGCRMVKTLSGQICENQSLHIISK